MIYFDNAATTRMKENALNAMLPYFRENYANPSGIYLPAGKARRAVEESREKLAELINSDRDEIIFTSGGSESNNLAIRGFCKANNIRGKHVITSLIEHPSVINTFKALEKEGYSVSWLKPEADGAVNPKAFEKAIREDTIFASVMHANNETGVINDIKTLSRIAHEHKICFHTDAVQSFGHIETDVKASGVDLMSVSGHKFGGPKGTGFLYKQRDIILEPCNYGGEQERGLRGGTENVPGIVGMTAAATETLEKQKESYDYVKSLRDRLVDGITSEIEGVILNGSGADRLPGHANFTFEGVQGESVIIRLSALGICGSTGSACTALRREPSHVLTAMGLDFVQADSSVRLTLGDENTAEEVDFTVDALKKIITDLRAYRRY